MGPPLIERLKIIARKLGHEALALHLAARDPRTPVLARWLAMFVVAYALSPIDLIPDFIPVLGHLDDLILVPLGIWLVLKLIPRNVMMEARERAALSAGLPGSRSAALVIVCLWVILALLLIACLAEWL